MLDPASVTAEDYRRKLTEDGRGWVYELDGRIVGFAVADLTRSNIWALFVDPHYERRGIGRSLHDAMLEWLFASGTANGMPAPTMRFLTRVRRAAIVGSGTRNARATSPVGTPQIRRSVRATRAAGSSAG